MPEPAASGGAPPPAGGRSGRRSYGRAAVLTAVAAFVLAVGTFAAALTAVLGTEGETVTVDVPAAPGDPAAGPGEPRPAPNQAFVSGTVTRLTGTGLPGPVLALPLTLTVAVRGDTGAEITGGSVGGRPAAVVWDGGRPLPLRGTGGLDLAGPADLSLVPGRATWRVDGRDRVLVAGSYALGATVAVGTAGIATPRDGVTVVVPPGQLAGVRARGAVSVAVPAGAERLRGPGTLVLEGSLTVRTPTGTRDVPSLRFGPGAFELDLEPVDGGYRVARGVLQGPYQLGP